jgi:hypothetical protein
VQVVVETAEKVGVLNDSEAAQVKWAWPSGHFALHSRLFRLSAPSLSTRKPHSSDARIAHVGDHVPLVEVADVEVLDHGRGRERAAVEQSGASSWSAASRDSAVTPQPKPAAG